MAESYRIAIAGLGTVGAGVVEILQNNADLIACRAGRKVEIVAVSARDKNRDRGVDLSSYNWVDNAADLAGQDVDAVVELIGGSEGAALDLAQAALGQGKDVVTANKALVAHHGATLAATAEEKNAHLAYEAAVAGGVPIIKALREGLAANNVRGVYGILNGTCNYILTEMRETGADFSDVLKDAQEKGYAEADPAFDIEGVDAGHKLAILTAIAFGVKPDFEAMDIRGITEITSTDIKFSREFGYRIKLLGIARSYDGRISQTVEPCLVPKNSPLGAIEGVLNAVEVDGDFVGKPMLTGFGAGKGATASSVVADIIDLARGLDVPTFGVPSKDLSDYQAMDMGETTGSFYVRLNVLDQPGVIADVSAILRDQNVSIESLSQHGRDPGQPVPIVMTTHEVRHADLVGACEKIENLEHVQEKPCMLRIIEL